MRAQVKRVLGSIDPLRYIGHARPGTVLLEDGRKDQIVPQAALRNIVRAAPERTTVHWYAARRAAHEQGLRRRRVRLARAEARHQGAERCPAPRPRRPAEAGHSNHITVARIT